MKKKSAPAIDAGKALLYGAATFQAYQFGRALNIYDPDGAAIFHINIGGVVLGALVNLTVALSATQIPVLRAKGRKHWGTAAFIALMALSPALVAPAFTIVFKEIVPTGAGWLAVGIALAPDLAIALGGFISGNALISLSATDSNRSASDKSESANGVRRSASDSGRSASDKSESASGYPRKCEHCDALLKAPQSVGGHMKKHHPELCARVAYSVPELQKAER